MKENHTPGPLMAIKSEENRLDTIVSGPVKIAVLFIDCFNFEPDQQEANARRIVACWNACEGIETGKAIAKCKFDPVRGFYDADEFAGQFPKTSTALPAGFKPSEDIPF